MRRPMREMVPAGPRDIGLRGWLWSSGLILALGCGGNAQGDAPPAMSGGAGTPGSGSSHGDAEAGGALGGKPPPPEQVCSQVGERRDPRADESAQYCVCEADLTW